MALCRAGENEEGMKASRPFRATQLAQLRDPDNAAVCLEEALAAGDVAAFKLALRNVLRPAKLTYRR
jgi:hypothetical protein